MELISFLIAIGISFTFVFFSVSHKSWVFGTFAGMLLLVVSIVIIPLGIQKDMVMVSVNDTGNVTVTTTHAELFGDGYFTSAFLGFLLLGVSLFVLYSSAFKTYTKR